MQNAYLNKLKYNHYVNLFQFKLYILLSIYIIYISQHNTVLFKNYRSLFQLSYV